MKRASFTLKASLALTIVTCLAPTTQVNADPPSYRIFYLGRLGTGSTGSQAFGLNDVGAVVGQSNVKAFVYVFTPAYGFTPLTITQIATNNFTSKANDINNAGQAVGQGMQSSTADPEAYLWSLASGAATATPLGILSGGFSSEAFQVNDASPAIAVG